MSSRVGVLSLAAAFSLFGCADIGMVGAAGHVNAGPVDKFPPVIERQRLCDFGILRGTKSMRCAEEFKRKEWYVWI